MKPATLILIAVLAALIVLPFLRWALWPRTHAPRFRVLDMRMRLLFRLRPGRGFACLPELWLRWGRFASFRESRRARPNLSRWYRATRPLQHSIYLGRAQFRHKLWLPVQEHLTVLGPPRVGKSGLLASLIMRYPGAVVCTSTKPDMFQLTSGIRAKYPAPWWIRWWMRANRQVEIFNPQRLGGPEMGSTIIWDPVADGTDDATAIRRAVAFCAGVSVEGMEDSEFWRDQASLQLRALLSAAALKGEDFRAVTTWVLTGDTEEAEKVLLANGRLLFASTLAQMRGKADKTAATIRLVLTQVVAFMSDPNLAATVLPRGDGAFDIPAFLKSGGTLYMIGESRGPTAPIGPLFAAMAQEIHWTACQMAGAMKGGRLDPPMLFCLDEVTQICPIPLPSILADSGGRGIQIVTAAHGTAQLEGRWKKTGARTILDTSNQMFLPGIQDPETLEIAAKLCGQATYRQRGGSDRDEHGGRDEHVDVAPVALVRRLPRRRALILRGSTAPVIARIPQVWRSWRYTWAKLRRHDVALVRVLSLAATPSITPAELLEFYNKQLAGGGQVPEKLIRDLQEMQTGGVNGHADGNGRKPGSGGIEAADPFGDSL